MSDYYMGLIVGSAAGYCLSLVTLLGIWALCIIAKRENEERRGD